MKILVVSVMLAWCSGGYTAGAQKGDASAAEERMRQHILQRFEQDPQIFSPDLTVSVSTSNVTVGGAVASIGEERRALEIAGSLRGVSGVVDEISIKAADRSDAEIRSDVRTALAWAEAPDMYALTVAVTNGIVRLSGLVQSLAERELSGEVAGFVRGVKGIENEIQVRPVMSRRDSEIAADINGLLRSDVRLADATLKAEVTSGRAVISGVVSTPTQKSIVAGVARVQGVGAVDVAGVVVHQAGVSRAALAEAAERQRVRSKQPVTVPDRKTSPEREAVLEAAIRTYLAAHPRIDVRRIQVRVRDGTAHLEGSIGTLESRNQVIEAVKNLGITRIVDQMRIRTAEPPESTDLEMARRLRTALSLDPYLTDDGVQATVIAGRVSLAGTVDSVKEKRHATALAERVVGIREVVNSLRIPSDQVKVVERKNAAGNTVLVPYSLDEGMIRDRVRDQLVFDSYIEAGKIQVEVEGETVLLSGTVQSEWQRARAVENAYEAGANRVIDKLAVAR